ncbi:tRNA 2-thiouridine(34) synthase MnmA [Legionella jordanis]|uniref:tRNA-specific 2-thiouridylase MnmA n=1 Tax=Legionella jordanis TaxID=456 RepID=A0A0W0V8V9_9GAMM|nr:tRNA 2-thiouridine(34) synthase MnmA [Legionella jordanis]KTD16073.1 tRNA-specific 2-thiouridylase MnmA [Legionella jordanis]RMX04694.1 tRNA 2-thiouridine(34) synthase MnmA [Legionella jordanis]RMX18403.1 tRNA 2-thiouridine(34) synthase MnmA [Legionella jordanis]VEH12467.1 tRNA (5-methylaminomethyl-2-thiouridylate)-methyltransferase [Legionella jordanis]HAT8713978.1 tRNA 2-thiouridine(34) synthase MnmA [Legionella jordanis]
MKAKVIVGMSGGVDSSVAAWLLREQGYEVEGLFMKNWEEDDREGYCAAAQDLADAQAVCNQLRIPLHSVNFSKEYWDRVFAHFLNEYENGRTPNPDVLCNKEIKFNAFLNHALKLGADYIATGHYAKVRTSNGTSQLLKSKDREKDQTYFLHAVEPSALARTLFPIGDYLKAEVRDFAKQLGLVTHAKKDSTGICFIGEKRFKTFLKEFLLAKPGDIKSSLGEFLGRHEGLMFYTLGQRQGLGIGGRQSGNDEPWYVVDKDIESNTLIVAQGSDHPLLYAQGLVCGPIHWLVDYKDQLPLTCYAKTRYRQIEQPCVISPASGKQHYVMFSHLQRAITPGQYIVFYEKNQCLGGATIEQIIR